MGLTPREDRLFKEQEPRLKSIVAHHRNGQPNPDITSNVHQLYLKIVLEGKRPVHTASDEEFYKYFCVCARNLLASELRIDRRQHKVVVGEADSSGKTGGRDPAGKHQTNKEKFEAEEAERRGTVELRPGRKRRPNIAAHEKARAEIEGKPHTRGPFRRSVDAERRELVRRELVRFAVSELSDEDWQLYYRIKMSQEEQTKVFRELGLPEATGRDRLNRIHRQLAVALRELDPEEGATSDG